MFLVIIQAMKSVLRIIVPVQIEDFVKNFVFVITIYAVFSIKAVIVSLNVKKNHVLVMLMTENVIRKFVKVNIFI